MTLINLLPWRETLRDERKRHFFIALGVSTALAIVIMVGVHLWMAKRIQNQAARNQFLKQEIQTLDNQILSIKQIKKQKALLVARMNIIQELQGNRPQIVHLFDELVKILPRGVFLTRVVRKGNLVEVDGGAESNTDVSELMRRITASKWLAKPVLKGIKTEAIKGKLQSQFSLRLLLIHPAYSAS